MRYIIASCHALPSATISVRLNTAEKMLYSLREAATELQMTVANLKHHLYVSRRFAGIGQIVGNSLVFTEADLQELKRRKALIRRGRSRQPKKR